MHISLLALKQGLLCFWALWSTIVFLTNACSGLKALGILPPGWKFASENYSAIKEAVSIYSPPDWLPGLLFAGVIVWQGAVVGLFWRACLLYDGSNMAVASTAFAASLALWSAFMIADETFRAYQNQSLHLQIFAAQLITLLAVFLLSS